MSPAKAIQILGGGLWHTTSEARFEGIRSAKAILAEPPIPETERWATRCGPAGWPYVRKLGGVSLFDFAGFCPRTYEAKYPLSSWTEFVPFRWEWGASVWIEIDRKGAAAKLVGPADLVDRWKREKAYRHRIMPHIEACFLGDLPSSPQQPLRACDSDWLRRQRLPARHVCPSTEGEETRS